MKNNLPTLTTKRLVLRPFQIEDAAAVQALAGDKRIYDTTMLIPHPYEEKDAVQWISSHAQRFISGDGVDLAVTLKEGGLIGAVGLGIRKQHRKAELGYWIGVPFWNRGYCTEADREIVRYGFEELDLHKISARHHKGNEASGRVMEKIGMQREGELVDESVKDGRFITDVVYGLINDKR